ncbi:complex I subunit 5 family protein [Sciscionella sediminilitoris]|uniref:complex I subunit 5 family protein n=1 Tax=Sciscionella sediminilitoris TaxID=1445613 RepID=UPI000AD8C01C|nr:complex I subunit 5 family protein [Sciscionella sp. SE31]
MPEVLLPITIAWPLLAACLLLMAGGRVPGSVQLPAILAVIVEMTLLGVTLSTVRGGRVVHFVAGWRVNDGRGVGIVLVGDSTGVSIGLLAAVLTGAASLFGWRYFESGDVRYHVLVLIFLGAMVGYALSGDLFDLFVFFELMGVAAFALTAIKVEEPRSVQGGFNFAIVNSAGAYLTLTGVALLYARTGRLGLAQLGMALDGQRADVLIRLSFVLVCTGWLVKAAVVPFHFWLADAHAVAPAPVCVLLSGIMAPLGVYGVVRTYSTVFAGALEHAVFSRMLLVFGTLTAVLGTLMCLLQRHVKRLLAYSTIAHIGVLLLLAAGHGPALWFYLVGHAGVKGALFLIAGVLLSEHGDIDEFGLFGKGSSFLGAVFVLGSLALAGLPPFAIGLGKSALEQGPVWQLVMVAAVSALTAGAVLRAGLRIFFGLGRPPEGREDSERTSGEGERPEGRTVLPKASMTMRAAVAILVLIGLGAGVVPGSAGLAGQSGAALLEHSGYLGAIGSRPISSSGTAAPVWSLTGALVGIGSAAFASLIALGALWRRPSQGGGRRLTSWLHAVHSGHVGDYITWLLIGVLVLGVTVMA